MNSIDADDARPSGASRTSRRAFLSTAGALVAGATLLPAGAADASSRLRSGQAIRSAAGAVEPADAVPLLPFAGAVRGAFEDMLKGVTVGGTSYPPVSPPPTAVRWYIDAKTYPNTTPGYYSSPPSDGGIGGWPDITGIYNSPAHALVSIRPDIHLLNSGAFDDDLAAFMSSAPAGPASLLTIWHEVANFTITNPNYPQLADAPAFLDALRHLKQLAAGTNVKVGAVNVRPHALRPDNYPGNPTMQDIYNMWMPANLDWYGCDLYDNATFDLSAYDELNLFRKYANSLPGSVANADWPINIPEINSPIADPNSTPVKSTVATTNSPTGFRRSDFFHYAWTWLQNIAPASHCSGLLGFWNGTGNLGSPWPPEDTPKGSLAAMYSELQSQTAQSWP